MKERQLHSPRNPMFLWLQDSNTGSGDLREDTNGHPYRVKDDICREIIGDTGLVKWHSFRVRCERLRCSFGLQIPNPIMTSSFQYGTLLRLTEQAFSDEVDNLVFINRSMQSDRRNKDSRKKTRNCGSESTTYPQVSSLLPTSQGRWIQFDA